MGDWEGGENKEYGIIYSEQYKHGGNMEYIGITVSIINTNTVAKSK
jgi:hypothetical protein